MNTQGFRGRYSSQTEKKVAKSKRLCFEQWLCRVAVKRTRVSPATGPGLSCFSSIHGLFAIQLGHLSTLSTWPGPEAGLRGASKPGPACPSPSLTHGPPRRLDCERAHVHSGCSWAHWALRGLPWDSHLEKQGHLPLFTVRDLGATNLDREKSEVHRAPFPSIGGNRATQDDRW